MDVGFPQQFAKLSYLRVPRVQFPKAPLMECVRLVEEPVLKTVGPNKLRGFDSLTFRFMLVAKTIAVRGFSPHKR